MRFASAITESVDVAAAAAELIHAVESHVTPGMVDLALLFATGHYEDDLDDIVEHIGSFVSNAVLIGCTAEGTLGHDREIERAPSMSLLVATLPDVTIRPFHLRQSELHAADDEAEWERMVGVTKDSQPLFVALADPFRFAVHDFIESLNMFYPGAPLVGGVASAGQRPEQNRLIINGEIEREGVVGVAMTGAFEVDTVVSQGCRPIGKPFVITRGERNVIRELGGRPALQQLHDVIVNLSPHDEELAKQSLFVGRVIDEYKDRFGRGDFLIHNILGVDKESGALGIAGLARVGTTVQFHVRDADSADEDLRVMLAQHKEQGVRGAMLFSCNGRGTHMWPEPGHDIGALRDILGSVPTAGFFCGGEFGPIGGRNFVHGFTASIALFRERSDESTVK